MSVLERKRSRVSPSLHSRLQRLAVSQKLWSSDHPSSCVDWPWGTINDHFAGVPDDEKYEILAGNALRHYGTK
jgi:hypothetical protein